MPIILALGGVLVATKFFNVDLRFIIPLLTTGATWLFSPGKIPAAMSSDEVLAKLVQNEEKMTQIVAAMNAPPSNVTITATAAPLATAPASAAATDKPPDAPMTVKVG